MESEEYDKILRRVAELVDTEKNYPPAVELLQSLIESDLPDIDRSMMSINMATVCDLMGHESHAEQWFDHAMALERPHHRCFAAMQKASYLQRKNRNSDAASLLQSLVDQPYLTLQERLNLINQVNALSAAPK